jgi:hypothetical protein
MSDPCTVCGEPAPDEVAALCNGCNERFHLTLGKDPAPRECGRVWVNEQFMTLEYGCLRCLNELEGERSIDGAAFTRAEPTSRRRYRKVR